MLSLACRDAGVKDCDYVVKGEPEEELWKNCTDHVIKVHGMKAEDVTPQFKESHRSYITRFKPIFFLDATVKSLSRSCLL